MLLLKIDGFLLISIYAVLNFIDSLLISIAIAIVLGFPHASMLLLKINDSLLGSIDCVLIYIDSLLVSFAIAKSSGPLAGLAFERGMKQR